MDFHYGFYDFANMDKLIFWQKKPPHQAEVFFIRRELTRQPATVHRNGVAVDVVRCRGGQEDNRPHQIAWQTPTARRDAVENFRATLFIRTQLLGVVGRM